jgi:hypothetical protein
MATKARPGFRAPVRALEVRLGALCAHAFKDEALSQGGFVLEGIPSDVSF